MPIAAGEFSAVASSSDCLACGSLTGRVVIFDVSNDKVVLEWQCSELRPIRSMRFVCGGKALVIIRASLEVVLISLNGTVTDLPSRSRGLPDAVRSSVVVAGCSGDDSVFAVVSNNTVCDIYRVAVPFGASVPELSIFHVLNTTLQFSSDDSMSILHATHLIRNGSWLVLSNFVEHKDGSCCLHSGAVNMQPSQQHSSQAVSVMSKRLFLAKNLSPESISFDRHFCSVATSNAIFVLNLLAAVVANDNDGESETGCLDLIQNICVGVVSLEESSIGGPCSWEHSSTVLSVVEVLENNGPTRRDDNQLPVSVSGKSSYFDSSVDRPQREARNIEFRIQLHAYRPVNPSLFLFEISV